MDPLETTTTKKSQRKTETEHVKGAHTQVLAQWTLPTNWVPVAWKHQMDEKEAIPHLVSRDVFDLVFIYVNRE